MSRQFARFIETLCVVIALNLVFTLIIPAPTVLACTPPAEEPTYTVADRVHAADVVLEGTVVALTSEDNYGAIQTATVDVDLYYKDTGPVIVRITKPDIIAQVIAATGHEPVRPYGHWLYLPIFLKPVSESRGQNKS